MTAPVKLADLADLIKTGQETMQQRLVDLRKDFDQKHEENKERRHKMVNDFSALDARVHLMGERISAVERDMRTVVGDNTGGSGLLHTIDKKVDKLQEDFSNLKAAVEDAPMIRRWVYGAMAVLAFLAITIPIALVVLFETLKLSK
jgi:predicted nuclease with TOPRIM domain